MSVKIPYNPNDPWDLPRIYLWPFAVALSAMGLMCYFPTLVDILKREAPFSDIIGWAIFVIIGGLLFVFCLHLEYPWRFIYIYFGGWVIISAVICLIVLPREHEGGNGKVAAIFQDFVNAISRPVCGVPLYVIIAIVLGTLILGGGIITLCILTKKKKKAEKMKGQKVMCSGCENFVIYGTKYCYYCGRKQKY